MNAKHTSGPWHVYKDHPQNPWLRIGSASREVADISGVVWNDRKHIGVCLANANLIAAAPDLLAALRDILNGQLAGQVDTDAPRFQRARAAIAKAEGK